MSTQTHAAQPSAQASKAPPFFSVQPRRESMFFSPPSPIFAAPTQSQASDAVQRKCASCEAPDEKLHRQAEMGEEESLQSKPERAAVQPKLNITPPDDPQEREADLVAEKVMRMPEPEGGDTSVDASGAADSVSRRSDTTSIEDEPVQRKCAECAIEPPNSEEKTEDKEPDLEKDNDKASVNPKSEPGGPGAAPEDLHSSLQSTRGSGQPMPAQLRAKMEGRFGEDFSAVRIHAGSSSAAMAKSIHAQAFTYGSDIYFNPNRYDPNSNAGQTLLAHELTHVIQQKGTHPLMRKVQRAEETGRLGNWAHHEIQARLRALDGSLITEAGIPGATAKGAKINSAGFADLYKSEGNKIAGVQAEILTKENLSPSVGVKYHYKNFLRTGERRKKIRPKDKFSIGPTIGRNGTWDFTTNFPSTFEVGEIKPLFPTEFTESLAYHGSAQLQVDKYINGFREFVEQVHQDIGAPVPKTITGTPLHIPESKIPPEINYELFEQEHARTPAGEHKILKNRNFKPTKEKPTIPRVWIYQFRPGMFVYFLIPHPYKHTEFPAEVDKQLRRLDPLLDAFRKKEPQMRTSIGTKLEPPAGRAPAISRKRIQAKDDQWTKAGNDWERQRKKWAKGEEADTPKPKNFLKEQARGVEKKKKVDKELKRTPSAAEKKVAKQVKDIRFWSSWKGRMFGALYFRFRKVFLKVEELMEKIKGRFRTHRDNATKLNDKDGIFDSWKKVATKSIIRIAVEIFKEMLGLAINRFMSCINAVVDSIIGKYHAEIDAEVQEESKSLEPLCCAIMDFRQQIDAEVAKHEKLITEFTEAVHTIQQWRQILTDVEIAVRIGVQVVSCGIPPGVGCLWGLVAQAGIEAGLSLLARCDYFEDNIAKPAANALMDAIVGDKLHNLTIDALEATSLKEHMTGLAPCARVKSSRRRGGGGSGFGIGGNLDKLNPNDPANIKAVKEWEAEFRDQIRSDLQQVFKQGDKTPLTDEQLKVLVDLLKKLQDTKKTQEEMQQMLEAARDAKSGKLDFERARALLESGKVPELQLKQRKIAKDAQSQNAQYQKKLGWGPMTFIKKPGLQADSQEFAEAVYDMQEALGIFADGIAGPETTMEFYEANKLDKDETYKKAVEVGKQERRAREDRKAAEAARKKMEELLKDEKVKEAMAAPFPADAELKKDLKALPWDDLDAEGMVVTKVKGRAVFIIKTSASHRLGAYFHFVEREFEGVKMPMIVKMSRFYVLDRIESGEQFGMLTRDEENHWNIDLISLGAHEQDSFFEWAVNMFGRFVIFE